MSSTTPSSGFKLTFKTGATIALGVLALIFIFQNTDSRRVNVFFWKIDLPSWIWMVLLFGAGVIVGLLVPTWRRHRSATSDRAAGPSPTSQS
jgi:uncharacterized integral membrane protein